MIQMKRSGMEIIAARFLIKADSNIKGNLVMFQEAPCLF